jgi:hypothetical protein
LDRNHFVGTSFVSDRWFVIADEEATNMLRIIALSGALATGLFGGAFAQTSGSAAQTDDINKPALLNTNSLAVKKFTAGESPGGSYRRAIDIRASRATEVKRVARQ